MIAEAELPRSRLQAEQRVLLAEADPLKRFAERMSQQAFGTMAASNGEGTRPVDQPAAE